MKVLVCLLTLASIAPAAELSTFYVKAGKDLPDCTAQKDAVKAKYVRLLATDQLIVSDCELWDRYDSYDKPTGEKVPVIAIRNEKGITNDNLPDVDALMESSRVCRRPLNLSARLYTKDEKGQLATSEVVMPTYELGEDAFATKDECEKALPLWQERLKVFYPKLVEPWSAPVCNPIDLGGVQKGWYLSYPIASNQMPGYEVRDLADYLGFAVKYTLTADLPECPGGGPP